MKNSRKFNITCSRQPMLTVRQKNKQITTSKGLGSWFMYVLLDTQ